jgi:hypothetical protein
VAGTSITFTVAGWPATGSGTLSLFGWNYIRNLFNGVTATNVAFDAQRKGWASGDTTATINTTAAPGTIIQNDVNGRDLFLADSLRASATSPDFTTRASRYENLPDDDLPLHLFIWSFNGTAAPASATTWQVGFVSVEKFPSIPVFLQGQRAQGNQNAAPVKVINSFALAANQSTNIAQIGGAVAMSVVGAGGTNRALGVVFAAPISVADVTAAARTASGNSGTIAQDLGNVIAGQITVTAVTGTSPTLDMALEQSFDNGTTWQTVWMAPRVTAAANIIFPPMQLTGRRRWVWTIGGTTPSFTIAVNVMAASADAPIIRTLQDRAIAPNTGGSASAALRVEGTKFLSATIVSGAGATSAPVYGIFVSEDGASWADTGLSITVPASSTVAGAVAVPFPAALARLQIKTAGVAATQTVATLRATS